MSAAKRGRKRGRAALRVGTWVLVWFETEGKEKASRGQITRFKGEEKFYVRFSETGKAKAQEWRAVLKRSDEGVVEGWQLDADHEPTMDQKRRKRRAVGQTTSGERQTTIAPLAILPRDEKTESFVEKAKSLLKECMAELVKHDKFKLVESIARCLKERKVETYGGVSN
jgi:hypothetical protein